MKRLFLSTTFLGLLALAWSNAVLPTRAADGVSGDGKLRFKVLYTSSILPAEAQAVLKGAHGGFAVDTRPGKGETYWALKGAGILQISADLKTVKLMRTEEVMKKTNLHNSLIWSSTNGKHFLTFPSNESQEVFTTDMNGKLLNELKAPDKGTDMGDPVATEYFKNGGTFVPTDVEQMDGMYYITTGYSKLDFVLTAKITSTSPFRTVWNDLAFGGRGTGPGQFGTGHGIVITPGTKRLEVADRPNSEIDRFTRYGRYLGTVNMPKGSFPCDIQYMGNYAIVPALYGPDRSKGAPIYIMENDQVVSTIMPKEELGLANFKSVHNAVLRQVNGKLYVIAQAWNPGDFAILEQVAN